MMKARLLIIIITSLFIIACTPKRCERIGEKEYDLTVLHNVGEINSGTFNKKNLGSAKMNGDTIIVPRIDYSGVNGGSWEYDLVINLYSKNADTDISLLKFDLVLPDSTVLASINYNSMEIHNNEGHIEDIKNQLMWYKDYAIISDTVLESTKKCKMLIYYLDSGQEKVNEFDVRISVHTISWIDYLIE